MHRTHKLRPYRKMSVIPTERREWSVSQFGLSRTPEPTIMMKPQTSTALKPPFSRGEALRSEAGGIRPRVSLYLSYA